MRRATKRSRRKAWSNWSDGDLLELRLCDLGVQLEGTWAERAIATGCRELESRNLRIRPHFWLSHEWFSPAGVNGVALPFYLAHPRLMQLERRQMLEVEGGTFSECRKLLRHELGHAVQHAFELQRRKLWRKHFGSTTRAYPDTYRPNPASRRYVLHLDNWYAQAHPDEDFAETFAVWLSPRSAWRVRYAGWPALKKLEYVDRLMRELAGRPPRVRSRARPEHLPSLRFTLRDYYEAKHKRYGYLTSNVYDADLRRLFDKEDGRRRGETAASFLRRHRAHIRHMVARGTGKHEYALEVVLQEMMVRCRELGLRATAAREQLLTDLAILLAARGVEYVYRRREWHAL